MDEKIKVLIAGDVNGNFNHLFRRVETINKKSGPFEMLLCVGEFFGENNDELIAYKNNCKNIPMPVYILGPNNQENVKYYENLENNEICSNLTYLGKRGLYTFSNGIKLAYLSGTENNEKQYNNDIHFNKDDVLSVRNSCIVSKGSLSDYRGVDILLTSQWPYGITEIENCSKLISFLVREIRPRYHFCGLNKIYLEPPPFRTQSDNITQLELATRFISLSCVNKTNKDKYIYGMGITPVDRMRVIDLIQKTANEIPCPYEKSQIFQIDKDNDNGKQYFFDLKFRDKKRQNNENEGENYKSEGRQQKRQRTIIDTEKCWFCLSSPNVEKHLVISIGNHFYIALDKGPINETHILILSIQHIQKTSLLSNDEWNELNKFKESLRNYFKHRNEVVCFFERNYRTSHLQINAIAIDADLEWKIKYTFRDKCEEYDIELETLPEITDVTQLPQQGPYFIAELPDKTVLMTRQMKNFPLHFARDVFCSENLLNCDEKVDWKACNLSKDEEMKLVKNFRENYKHYDFTLL